MYHTFWMNRRKELYEYLYKQQMQERRQTKRYGTSMASYNSELTGEQEDNNANIEENSNITPIHCSTNHGDVSAKNSSQETLVPETKEEPVVSGRKKKKSKRKKKKKTSTEQAVASQDGAAVAAAAAAGGCGSVINETELTEKQDSAVIQGGTVDTLKRSAEQVEETNRNQTVEPIVTDASHVIAESGIVAEQVKGESQMRSESQVKGQSQMGSESQVKGESQVTSESQVKGESQMRSESQVKGESQVTSESQVKGESQMKSESHVKGESQMRSESQAKGESHMTSESQVKGESEVTSNSEVTTDSLDTVNSQITAEAQEEPVIARKKKKPKRKRKKKKSVQQTPELQEENSHQTSHLSSMEQDATLAKGLCLETLVTEEHKENQHAESQVMPKSQLTAESQVMLSPHVSTESHVTPESAVTAMVKVESRVTAESQVTPRSQLTTESQVTARSQVTLETEGTIGSQIATEAQEKVSTTSKKKKTKEKKKKTNLEQTVKPQEETDTSSNSSRDSEITGEIPGGNATPVGPTTHNQERVYEGTESETERNPTAETQKVTPVGGNNALDGNLNGEQKNNTGNRMWSYAECVKTGKLNRKIPKYTRNHRDTTESFHLSGHLYSTTLESDAESIASFQFDEEEDDFDMDDSDVEISEEEEINIGDNTETWFEKSCKKYGLQENTVETSEDDVLDTNVLTEGVELTDAYIEKFTRNSETLKRAEFYSLKSANELLTLCKNNPSLYVCCRLEIQSPHKAVATLLNPRPNLKTIAILGRSKCGQAFTEDEVVVEILNKNNFKKDTSVVERDIRDADAYGKVIGIIERVRHRDIEHPVFIATQDPRAGHLMIPICKTIPKVSVLTENIKQHFPKQRMHKVERYEYVESKGILRYQGITHIKPEERDQYRYLVCFLHWGKKYVYPRGAVIGIVRTDGTDIRTGLKIIGIQYQVPTLYDELTVREVQSILETHVESANGSREDLTERVAAFTIDPPFSKDLDDALSVQALSKDMDVFVVGVHIADVTAIVPLDSNVDKEARFRCSTYYSVPQARALHMLPEPLSREKLSLLPNQKRAAISVFFTMKENGSLVRKPVIQRTCIQSRKRLTYEEAQTAINTPASSCSDPIHHQIKLLNYLAQNRRRYRLKGALNAFPVEIDDSIETNDFLHNIDAHNLVEEFMIMANHAVGQYLVEECSVAVPLRCQDAPENDTLSSWVNKNTHLADIIVALQDRQLNTVEGRRTLNVSNAPTSRWTRLLPIQTWVWKAIVEAAKNNEFQRVKQLIGSDDLHPQQSYALQEWISFQETGQYKCSGSMEHSQNNAYHFSLGLINYVHFTSPIRRYVDIVVHRLLHATMDGLDKLPYTESEIEDICNDMNRVRQRSKAYQKQCNMLLVSTKLKQRPLKLIGFVEDMSDEGVILHFPGLKHVQRQKRMLRFNLLDVASQPQNSPDLDLLHSNTKEERQLTSVMWQRRIYLHKGFEKKKAQKLEQNDDDFTTVYRVDPHQRTTFLKYTAWKDILNCLNMNYSKLIEQIKDIEKDIKFGATRQYVQSSLKAELDVSCENRYSVFVKPICKFKFPFHLNQTVAVQMTAEYDRGTLSPYIQAFDMTRTVSFCLQHVDNPVKYLARYATAPTKPQYSNLQDYIRTWLPIAQMETAVNAVRNEESASITGIPIQFRGKRGKFYLNIRYCKLREIEFGNTALEIFKDESEEDTRDTPANNVKEKQELKEIVCSNYLCIRCPVKRNIPQSRSAQGRITDEKIIWIGHGEFTHMRKKKVDKCGHCYEIHFRLQDDNAPAPMKVAEIPDGCSLEILMKSKVDRRTENLMKLLPEASCLATAVALAKQIPKMTDLHNEIAKEIPRDVETGTLPQNNHQQRKAIENALMSRFSLIQGPPGTGKTFTGIKLIYLFNLFNQRYYEKTQERRQLVFSGPSNKSVDLVAKQVLQRLSDHAPKIIRMYGQAYENLDFPVPGKISSSYRTLRDSKPDEDLKESGIVLHHVIREYGKPFADELKEFDKIFMDNPHTASIEDIDKYQEILSKATKEELTNYDVILCTTSMAGNPKLLKATKGKVYQCIIDECGMCTEPECMVPLIATRAEQVVLIGDHMQLQPIILCKEAGELGLETSLFERYAKLQKKMEQLNMKYTMLVWQYRMNPKICEFSSKKFYQGKLKTAKSKYWMVEKPLRIWKFLSSEEHIPLAFCHIEGSEEVLTVSTEQGNERSRKNKEEAKHVARIFKHLIDVEKVKINHIQIITQYNAQRHAIKEALVEGERIINTKINTVVKSQGSEWDYVIFSTVRSLPRYLIENNPTIGWCRQNLGFITDQHQINVALTRARKGLIIIGNKHLLRCDEVWRDLITKYESEGLMYTQEQFPPSRQGRQNQQPRPPRFR